MPTNDSLWKKIYCEAEESAKTEPMLANFLRTAVLDHNTMSEGLSLLLATKLNCQAAPVTLMRNQLLKALNSDQVVENLRADICAFFERDSACDRVSTPFLYHKGFHALQAWRCANYLWLKGEKSFALLLQSRISMLFGMDIHPAARIGKGVMFDHGTGVVIGETAVVSDCVSIMQSVTLGGTGKESGDRHPKIGRGVLIGPGAKILGNIEIGEGSKVTAASVVLQPVAPHSIVAGVPAKVVGKVDIASPSESMDQSLSGCSEC